MNFVSLSTFVLAGSSDSMGTLLGDLLVGNFSGVSLASSSDVVFAVFLQLVDANFILSLDAMVVPGVAYNFSILG